jgi:hypothetical protein
MNREQAERIIRESPLSTGNTELLDSMRESIRIRPEPTKLKSLPLGASRFGELLDLPSGFKWPSISAEKMQSLFGRKAGDTPLTFVAQINLAEASPVAPDMGLPREGTLHLFCLDEGWVEAGIGFFHAGSADDLVRADKKCPQPKKHRKRCCALTFAREWTIDSEIVSRPSFEESVDFDFNQGGMDIFSHLEALQAALSEVGETIDRRHRILGHADWLQGAEGDQLEAHRRGIGEMPPWDHPLAEELRASAADWHPLLQIDSDPERLGWCWGDMGMLYLMIHGDSLRAGNLNETQFLFQSC